VFKTLNWRLTKCKLQIQFHYNDGIQEKKFLLSACLSPEGFQPDLRVAFSTMPHYISCPAHMTLNDSLKHNALEGVHYVIFLTLCHRDHKKIKQCEQKNVIRVRADVTSVSV
jgi:adenosylcobinamide amidohydrolase